MTPDEIREARRKLGLSRTQLAARLPCSYETVVSWEQGRRKPPDLLSRALRDLEREMVGAAE